MCSGCSGNYQADGEWEEMPRRKTSEKQRSDSLGESVPAGVANVRNSAGFHFAGCRPSADEYDVFVGEDRIVEVRRTGLGSPVVRIAGRDPDGSLHEKAGFFRHSGRESAKCYGTPEQRARPELLRFEARQNWRDFNELSVVERLARALRSFWARS